MKKNTFPCMVLAAAGFRGGVLLRKIPIHIIMTLVIIICTACATANPSGPDELDRAIREASDYINKNVPAGSKLAILNIKSNYPPFSEYIIDVLTENVVNDRVFMVVDRANLELIQQEMDFQLSGEVSDVSAQSIGRKLGAQTIISGSITAFGNLWRLSIRALGVEGATVQGMFNRNMPNGTSIAALTSGGAAAASASAAPGRTPPGGPTVPAAPAAPAIVYKVGDTGPAGGIIFHDKGAFTNGWRYLEAAPADIVPVQWGPVGNEAGETSTAVGTGKANTGSIAAVLERRGADGAALFCRVQNINGFTDWFLPSRDELNLLYTNLKVKGLGGFGSNMYWSSSVAYASLNRVWAQRFSDGRYPNDMLTDGQDGSNIYSVRAIRQF